MDLLVSVIIPNYNHASFLRKRIDSILTQTYQNIEIIILDDCSSDNSREIIESYLDNAKISHVVFNESNSGTTFKQWKKGIDLAKGEYIWIAESDDRAEDTFLEKLTSLIYKNNSVTLVYCQSYDIDENDEIIGDRATWTFDFEDNPWRDNFCLSGPEFLQYLTKKNVIPNASACLIKRKHIQQSFNSQNILDYTMCGDWLTWISICLQPSTSIAFINDHLNFFRSTRHSTRNHYSTRHAQKRLREELSIFYSIKCKMEKTLYEDKIFHLKIRWINLFSFKNFSYSLFDICNILEEPKFSFFIRFIKSKLRQTN